MKVWFTGDQLRSLVADLPTETIRRKLVDEVELQLDEEDRLHARVFNGGHCVFEHTYDKAGNDA